MFVQHRRFAIRNQVVLALVPVLAAMMHCSCSRQHEDDRQHIDALRYTVEDRIRTAQALTYKARTAHDPAPLDAGSTPERYLFKREDIDLVRRARMGENDGVQRKRLSLLQRYLMQEFMRERLAPHVNARVAFMERAVVRSGAMTVPYKELSSALSDEPSRARRSRWYTAAIPLHDTLASINQRVSREASRVADTLGFDSLSLFAEETRGVSMVSMIRTAESTLAETESLYYHLLDERVASFMNISRTDFQPYDVDFLLRSREFDKYFPADSTMSFALGIYRSMNMELPRRQNLLIETDTSISAGGARCYPLDVPHDVRLVYRPSSGLEAQRAFLHALGIAIEYATIDQAAVEFTYLADPVVRESFALLSSHLLANQALLRTRTRMPTSVTKALVRHQALEQLFAVRMECARILCKMQAPPQGDNQTCGQLLAASLGFSSQHRDASHFLSGCAAAVGSIQNVQARFLEAHLDAQLSREYGVNWFEHPAAGSFLQSLWAEGGRLDREDVARRLGLERITSAAWLERLHSMIRFSTR
jgi:hypothetical protein